MGEGEKKCDKRKWVKSDGKTKEKRGKKKRKERKKK